MSSHTRFQLPGNRVHLLTRLLETIEHDIAPMTRRGVAAGNKLFGAALLRKADLSLVLAETNNETENPLWHGEMHCLKRFYERNNRPATKDLVFLSTHEPCSLCLSAITWAGFDNFFYLFSYQDSRDSFAIPHDLNILAEVFGIKEGQYNRCNHYWTGLSIRDEIQRLVAAEDRTRLLAHARRLSKLYDGFSRTYQGLKDVSSIPLG